MCDFLTAATVGSMALSIVGGIQGQQISNANAQLARSEARSEQLLASVEERQVQAKHRRAQSRQRAEIAAAGFTLASATAQDLGRAAVQENADDVAATRVRRFGRSEALMNESRIAKATGRQQLLGGFTSAAGTLLTAAPDIWPGLQGGEG